MCTVSIITLDCPESPAGASYRIVCNRDENRRRPLAAPPRWRNLDLTPARAIWPMDTEGGGTWIGATQAGLCLCLLNLNPEPPIELRGRGQLRSRGLVIPELLRAADGVGAVMDNLPDLGLRHYAPFRLLAVGPSREGLRVAEARWDRTNLDITFHAAFPLCLVSSGLGDALVQPRLDLFEELVVRPGPSQERQDEFHRHRWPTRPELSVMMSREDARTVSVTTLEVIATGAEPIVTMGYEPVPEPVVASTLRARQVLP